MGIFHTATPCAINCRASLAHSLMCSIAVAQVLYLV